MNILVIRSISENGEKNTWVITKFLSFEASNITSSLPAI
jgi:hypothetical protein